MENWIDANRERLHVKQVYSWYSEQEGSSTVTLDEKYAKDIKALQEELASGPAEVGAYRLLRRQPGW